MLRDKVEAAYARTDLLERRRPLVEEWGRWCTQPGRAEIVQSELVRRTAADAA